jgi:hypothetical protein
VQNLGASSGFGPHAVYFASKVTGVDHHQMLVREIGPASEWERGFAFAHESSGNKIIGQYDRQLPVRRISWTTTRPTS